MVAGRTDIPRHDVAVVLGSGWQGAVGGLGETRAELDVAELPGFRLPTVAGHRGRVRSVRAGGHDVLVLVGRVHLYEGASIAEVVHPVRVAVAAGARVVVLTNAAGGLDTGFRPGQAVAIRDHLNLTGASPLTGLPDGAGPGFVDLTDCWSPRLRALAAAVDPTLSEGVYAGLLGPQYETPAEVAALRVAGADLVGMSTVLEAIAARHLGAELLGLSLVTNLAAGVGTGAVSHTDVLAVGADAAPALLGLVAAILERV